MAKDLKIFNIRISKDLWRFLKMQSMKTEKSLNTLVKECLEAYKKKIEK